MSDNIFKYANAWKECNVCYSWNSLVVVTYASITVSVNGRVKCRNLITYVT